MKKHCYKSLGAFYADVKNEIKSWQFDYFVNNNNAKWIGLSLKEIMENKYSYPIGIEKLSHFKDIEIEKDINVKYWNQFDGYDIDIDRMMNNLDFLVDSHKKRLLPKSMDIYINIAEGYTVDYEHMLCKTYAAIKIIDRLETLGVRCAVYACAGGITHCHTKSNAQDFYIEVCVKNYSDALNLGVLCTAISPWFFRHWIIMFIHGRYRDLKDGTAYCKRIPSENKGIIIETGKCLNKYEANSFIESIKV